MTTFGFGYTWVLKVFKVPWHPFNKGVTVYVTSPVVKRLFIRISEIVLPDPGEENPVMLPAVQAAVQVKEVPVRSACRGKLFENPEQIVSLKLATDTSSKWTMCVMFVNRFP